MARPIGAMLGVCLIGGLVLSGLAGPVSAQDAVREKSPQSCQYEGPMVLKDPQDPLQSVCWTLGLTIPARNRLPLGRQPANSQTDYDLQRERVTVSYRSGQQDILPTLVYTGNEYGAMGFDQGLRSGWIEGNGSVIQESQARANRDGGLLDISLPTIPFTDKLFGYGAPNLRVTGSEQITISGTSSWVVGQVTGERGGASLFPKLDMRQNLRVNLEGTIGSKLFINVSQNSDALTPLENSLQIRYRGEEDEVIQSVELGNTNLSLPPTQFVSYSSRQEGLFGIKTTASVGNLDLTAIASRQEGESGQATFSGGNQERRIYRKDWEFIPGKYFFITDPDTSPALDPASMQIRVYLDDRNPNNNTADGAQEAEVWVDPDAMTPADPYVGSFHLLQVEQDYKVFSSPLLSSEGFNITVLELTAALSARHVLAVTYDAVAGGERDTVGDFYRDPADSTIIQLKMIRPGDDSWGTDGRQNTRFSTWNQCRRLEVKSVYYLGARDIDAGTFELRIVRDIAGPGGNNPFTLTNRFGIETPLIEILGLDQVNNANTNDRTPDGRVDEGFINYPDGVIWFPDLRPFDPSRTDISGTAEPGGTEYRDRSWPVVTSDNYPRPDTLGWTQDSTGAPVPSRAEFQNLEVVSEIYDLLPNQLSLRASDFHKYSMEASVKSASASTIQLTTIGAVLEGSETVRLNGQVLERGTDYTIFYETGTITLKKAEATAPGADLIVTYSFDSPFTRSQQSLVGGSLQTHPDPNANLSFSTSWLHESRGSPDLRPRLGQEPTKMTVGDISGKLQLESWGLTRLMDAIPGVRTNAPSRVEFWAAAGVSLPDPNTRGDVYIDDMEGANNVIAPGINRGAWFYSSVPEKALEYMTRGEGTPLFEYAPNGIDRGELLWFSPNTVKVADITPREDADQSRDDLVNVLETIYIPQENVGTGGWGGLVTPLAAGGVDVSRAQFVEIWVNDYVNYANREQRRGEILIDVGSVNEDAVWDPLTPPKAANDTLDVEDKNQSGGQIDFDEDIGLDALFNEEELIPSELRKGFSPAYPQPDRSGDDRVPEINTSARERNISERIAKYSGVNGTEGNQRSDREDLDGNFLLDRRNDYVEYRVDLSAPAIVDNGRDFGVDDPTNGWRRYRIPLEEFHLSVGIPNLSLVKHMRVWFKGIDPGDTLDVQIASIEIVGNRWESAEDPEMERGTDEIFNVSTVNNRENPEYVPPFEVERINNVQEREQSLSLDFENMSPGNEYLAFNRQFEARDYTLYQTINYYVNPRLEEASGDSVEFFLRFGSNAASDDVTYYEISTVLSNPDPRQVANGWLEFAVPVADLSTLKVSGTVLPDSVVAEKVDLGSGLRATVVGAPSMSRVRRVSVGIRNITDRTLPLGRVWFDELRMGDVRRDRGVASRGFVSLQLADVANFQASADFNSADFLRLGDTDFRGSGSENIRYDLRGQIAVHKFLSFLRINAPLALRLSQGKNTPKFRPNSDVLFTGESSGREITRTVDKNITMSLARDIRGGSSPITRYTIDGIRLNASAGETFRDEVTVADSTFRKQGSVSYNLSLGHLRPFRPLGVMDFYLWPKTFTVSAAGGQVTRRTWSPEVFNPNVLQLTNNSLSKTGNMNIGTSFQPINGLTYSFASNRDLIEAHFDNPVIQESRPPDTFLGINVGRQILQTHNINFSYSPPILGTIRPRFTWTSGSNKNMSPSLTLENYAAPVFDIRNNNSANLSITVPLGKWMSGWFGPPRGGTNPTQPLQQPAGNDSALVPAPSGSGGRGELAMLFTDVIRLKDIQVSGSVGHRSGYSRVNGTPPINYIMGFTRDIGFGEQVGPVENAPFNQSSGRSNGVRGNTAINIFRQIGVDLAYSKRRDTAQTNSLLGNIRDDTTWPEVTINWGEIERRLPFLNKIFSDFRIVSTNFSKVTGTNGTEINPKESVSSQTNWRPLLSISGTFGGWRTSMNANRSSMETVTERVGGGKTTSSRSQMSYAINFAKKFVRVVGGQGRDVDFKADVSYTTNSSENRSSFSDIPIEDRRDQLRLNTSAGIRLTSAMSGTIGIELGQERNVTKAWTRRSIRLYFSTGFSF